MGKGGRELRFVYQVPGMQGGLHVNKNFLGLGRGKALHRCFIRWKGFTEN